LNRYIKKIQAYTASEDLYGVAFIYATIFNKIFLFDLPEIDYDDSYINSTKTKS